MENQRDCSDFSDLLDCEFYGSLGDMLFTVNSGDVYVNGNFAGQMCWTPRDIGNAIAVYIAENFV